MNKNRLWFIKYVLIWYTHIIFYSWKHKYIVNTYGEIVKRILIKHIKFPD